MRTAWWLVGALLATVVGGCQLAARDELRRGGARPTAVPALPAPVVDGLPGSREAPLPLVGSTDGADPAGAGAAPAAAAVDGEDRRRMVDTLARLREEFIASAKELIGTNGWGSIPALATRLAGQASQVPGWHAVLADDLDQPLREAGVHALVCRGLVDGAGACISADALLPSGAALCADAVRVLQQARAMRQGLAFEQAAKAVGFPDDPALVQAARGALVDANAADCVRLGPGPGESSGWSEPLCRVLASGSSAGCDELPEPSRRAICRGLARALLDTVGRSKPSGQPLEEMYRRWSLGGDATPECLAEPLAVLATHALVQPAFTPDTAALGPLP